MKSFIRKRWVKWLREAHERGDGLSRWCLHYTDAGGRDYWCPLGILADHLYEGTWDTEVAEGRCVWRLSPEDVEGWLPDELLARWGIRQSEARKVFKHVRWKDGLLWNARDLEDVARYVEVVGKKKPGVVRKGKRLRRRRRRATVPA